MKEGEIFSMSSQQLFRKFYADKSDKLREFIDQSISRKQLFT